MEALADVHNGQHTQSVPKTGSQFNHEVGRYKYVEAVRLDADGYEISDSVDLPT